MHDQPDEARLVKPSASLWANPMTTRQHYIFFSFDHAFFKESKFRTVRNRNQKEELEPFKFKQCPTVISPSWLKSEAIFNARGLSATKNAPVNHHWGRTNNLRPTGGGALLDTSRHWTALANMMVKPCRAKTSSGSEDEDLLTLWTDPTRRRAAASCWRFSPIEHEQQQLTPGSSNRETTEEEPRLPTDDYQRRWMDTKVTSWYRGAESTFYRISRVPSTGISVLTGTERQSDIRELLFLFFYRCLSLILTLFSMFSSNCHVSSFYCSTNIKLREYSYVYIHTC